MTAQPAAAARTTASGRGSGRVRLRPAVPAAVAVLLLALVLLTRSEIAEPVRIASGSMSPTLDRGDVVLVDRRVALDQLHRGDLVTFTSPADGEQTLKRVVALPGDVVSIEDSRLHVGGREVDEPYVDRTHWDAQYTGTLTVPDDAVYVLGDDRGASIDSRNYGPVPLSAVDGQVAMRLWPPGR